MLQHARKKDTMGRDHVVALYNYVKDDGLELEDHDCENDQLPVSHEIAQDLLLKLDPYKSMRPDRFPPRILKELADVITKLLLIIFGNLQRSQLTRSW
ncbi:hypothetical protein WISP_106549 [Willisornis vidua]|uniref:Uncharacterized protein n=1 Tax=Willisornis vidua TaxID=1566151 RepID=A0ABQ9D2Q2_9PASS|nr:hypothetical protein WISP_106549 [Willisornis vidua]